MPNIIEQQDILKGLPDSRLAMLMQSPTGDIPPFLVAAEAQRRQAIRQQFSGDAGKESVVDMLTKQMAPMPQNLNVPLQDPAKMPTAGISAIQPQAMAGGGAVAASAARSQPWDKGLLSNAYNSVVDYFGPGFTSFGENIQKYGINPPPDQIDKLRQESEVASPPPADDYKDPFMVAGKPAPYSPRNPAAAQEGTSTKNQEAPAEDEMRKRLESLYGNTDLSESEKAMKWFAMSQQFLDPSKTLAQSLAGAAGAWVGGQAEQDRYVREQEQAKQEAMLKYDIDQRNREAEAAAAERARTSMSAKDTATVLQQRATAMERVINDAEEKVNKMRPENGGMATPEQITAAEGKIADMRIAYDGVMGELSSLIEQSYGPIKFDQYSLRSGFSK